MAQRFKAKTLISNSGVFNNEVIAPNLVYNTGNQTIAGFKTFSNQVVSNVAITAPNIVYNIYDQTIDGVKRFTSTPNVNGTGFLLSGEATILYTTGDQNISGVKTFANSGLFLDGIKVGENGIEGGYSSGSISTDGLLGIQYNGYFDGDPIWFNTGSVRPIITQLGLAGASPGVLDGTYTQAAEGLSYFTGDNGFNIYAYRASPPYESYWFVSDTSSFNTSYFISYDLETWETGVYGVIAPTATILQTKNYENGIDFGINRGLINGTSSQWVGYFKAPETTDYNFTLNADEVAYFWTGDKALNGYTTGNADIGVSAGGGSSQISTLNSGQYYPVRLQWGHPPAPTSANLSLSVVYNATNFYNFSGLFFNRTAGSGFYIDGISGNASFGGNIQSNTATFNNRPTVNGTGVLLSGEVASLPDTIVYTTGNQTISGIKTFATGIVAPNLVYNTGDQTISGVKTFSNKININGYDTDTNNESLIGYISGNTDTNGDNQNLTISMGNASHGTLKLEVNPTVYLKVGETGFDFKYGDTQRILTNQDTANIDFTNSIGIFNFNTGIKTSGNLQVSGTGIFNAIDLNSVDIISLSGVDVTITSGLVVLTNPVSAPNLVYNTGNQTISGVKTFATGIVAPNLVYNTGNQNISGVKTFIGNQTISGNLTVSGNIINSGIADIFPASTGQRRYYPEGFQSMTTVSPFSGYVSYHPFLIKKDITNPQLCVELVTSNITNTPIRVGIYSGNNGFEGAKLFWSGSIPTTNATPAIYKTTANINLPKGPYIIASCNTGVSVADSSQFRSVGNNLYRSIFGETVGTTVFSISSTFSTLAVYETGNDLKPIIGSGLWSTAGASFLAPLVCLEY